MERDWCLGIYLFVNSSSSPGYYSTYQLGWLPPVSIRASPIITKYLRMSAFRVLQYLVFAIPVYILEVLKCLNSINILSALLGHPLRSSLYQVLHQGHGLGHGESQYSTLALSEQAIAPAHSEGIMRPVVQM